MSFPARQPLPLNIGDVQLTPNMLQGYKYVSGVPTTLQAFLKHPNTQFGAFTQDKTVIYIGPGKQRCFITSARGWLPGARLLAVAHDSVNTFIYVLIRVLSYNASTGELWFENLYQNLSWPNLYGNWYLTDGFPDTILSTPLAVASGGTGAGDIDTARYNLQKPRPKWGWPTLLDDFVGTPIAAVEDIVAGTVARPTLIASPDNILHPGVMSLDVTSAGDDKLLRITPNFPVIGLVNGSVYEVDVYLPALSTGAQRFKLRVGYDTDAADNYLVVNYSDNLNGGKLQVSVGVGGVDTSTDTGITVAIDTWYKIRYEMLATPGDVAVSINGVSMGTYSGGFTINSKWVTRMQKTIGNTLCSAYCDYVFLRQMFSTPRI